ncbi:IS66 family transposase [Thiothrix fructosivorans]|uniref:IS66 family transposase n=1 Tax=Thiothrix fructosivorans TaxID=111770 RepID=UPI0024175779|nr:transposase [Thiothrix fructosivorans]
MSDGYAAYRHHPKRLRCWAHLIRKARGLAESLDKDGRTFGNFTLAWLRVLQDDIYAWRAAGGTVGTQTDVIRQRHQAKLLEFRALCLIHAVSAHDKTAALAKEFINDWDAIFRILDHPWLPLTNNEAERALRHWVILRKTNHGTKSATGAVRLPCWPASSVLAANVDSLPWLILPVLLPLPALALPCPLYRKGWDVINYLHSRRNGTSPRCLTNSGKP